MYVKHEKDYVIGFKREVQYARAVLVGFGAGIIAVLFQYALAYAEDIRNYLLNFLKGVPGFGCFAFLAIVAVSAGIAGWLTARFAPEASGSGIPHIKGVLLHVRSLNWKRLLPVKFAAGVLSIGSGLSLGREGPTVQMGAAVGRAVGEALHLRRKARGQLMAAGAGAGLAAAFNAPLAGFIFTIEELQRELSPLTYGISLISAAVADVVTRSIAGQRPSFHVPEYPAASLAVLPLFALLGLLTGGMGILFNRSLLWSLGKAHALSRVPRWVLAGLAAVIAGLLAWWMPQVAGGGHKTAEAILNGNYNSISFTGFLAVLLIAKFGLTIASYATGVPGGIFAPLLVLGALIGIMLGQLSQLMFPSLIPNPAPFAVVGMAAAFSGIVRAPLTGIVLILEMTGSFDQLFPLLIACMVAFLVGEWAQNKPVYDALLEYDLKNKGLVTPKDTDSTLITVSVEPHSFMDGRKLKELDLPEGCLLVLVSRAGSEIIPTGGTRLQAGDQVTAMIDGNALNACLILKEGAKYNNSKGDI